MLIKNVKMIKIICFWYALQTAWLMWLLCPFIIYLGDYHLLTKLGHF